jgi:HK97 family phage prohead protease
MSEDLSGTLLGYAARYYDGTEETEFVSQDYWTGKEIRERIAKGAFKRALAEGQDVKALFDHNTSQLLGRRGAGTLKLKSDKQGLLYEIQLAETTIAQDVRTHVERGDLVGSSFAFTVEAEKWEKKKDGTQIRTIQDVNLFDVGPVVNPAYSGTSVEAASCQNREELSRKAFLARVAERWAEIESR